MEHNGSFGTWLENKRGTVPLRTFAEQVGVDAGTLSRTERNCTEVLVSTAVRICWGLDLSLCEFLQDWQGSVWPNAGQLDRELGQGVLTGKDVQRWLLRLLEGHRRNRELLIAALNLTVLRSGLLSTPLPQLSQLFSLADIEKLLWEFPWLRFEIEPPLQCESIVASLGAIYQRGGLILPSEIGAYIQYVRRQSGISFKQCSDDTHVPQGTLSSIENGMVKHLKLYDLLKLDQYLQMDGRLVALYWWEVSNRLIFEQAWHNELPPITMYSSRVKHTLVSLLVSVGRWLQYIYQDDTIWLAMLRHELGLARPRAVEGGAL